MPDQTQQQFKREVACVVKIKDLVNGEYVKEGGWTPNYILTNTGKKVSRVNIMGVVVPSAISEGANYNSLLVDDGSDRISVRDFEENSVLNKFKAGDVVQLIGRPRQYGQEKYVVPELIKPIKNLKWLEVRKIKLKNLAGEEMKKPKPIKANEELVDVAEDVIEDVHDNILSFIQTNDSGEGVDVELIVKSINHVQVESAIGDLLKKGEIFEVLPGRLKRL